MEGIYSYYIVKACHISVATYTAITVQTKLDDELDNEHLNLLALNM